jgi:hypothetical protein
MKAILPFCSLIFLMYCVPDDSLKTNRRKIAGRTTKIRVGHYVYPPIRKRINDFTAYVNFIHVLILVSNRPPFFPIRFTYF